jgi:hypothetical protein
LIASAVLTPGRVDEREAGQGQRGLPADVGVAARFGAIGASAPAR